MFVLIFQDIAAGLLLSAALLVVLIPVVDRLDGFLLTGTYAPLLVIPVSIGVIVFYPNADKWTPTRYISKLINKDSINTFYS